MRLEVATDITERKQWEDKLKANNQQLIASEKSLRESEERFRLLIENTLDTIWSTDQSFNMTFVNNSITQFLGYTPEEFLGLNPEVFTSKEGMKTIKEAAERLIYEYKQGNITQQKFEVKQIRKDGKLIDVEIRANLLFNDNNEFIGFQGRSVDITERKLAEEALKKSEKFSKDVIDSMMDGFSMLDNDGVHLDVNRSFSKITGFSKQELIGTGVPHPYWPEEEYENIQKAFEKTTQGVFDDFELVFKKKNGERFPVIVSPSQVKDNKGNAIAIFASIKDITERKQAEEVIKESEQKLRESNAEKDKFFSIIAHDLKSPFNSIMGFSDLLVEQVQENDYDGIEEYAEIIYDSSQLAIDLLMNLMEWSRSQTGRMEFLPEYLDISDITNETVDLLKPIAGQKSITIKNKISKKAIAFADKAMINTVIRNLISNAIKFTKSGGEIKVSANTKPNELIISVSDTGIGIPKDKIEKLFVLSESYSSTGTNKEKGTGLGLILCKEFVEKNGGKIWVESNPDGISGGKGSTFYFTLPYNP